MNTRDRLAQILLDQKKPEVPIDEERVKALLEQGDPDTPVDWEEVQHALGYSSLQVRAFLNAANKEFGKEITDQDLVNAKGVNGVLALFD